ncbi:MAG: response regulator [Rhodothermales bacterium]
MTNDLDVLLVEDSAFFRDVILAYLRPLNLKIEMADNGSNAIEILTRLPIPRLIICDVHMPDMDGIELTRRLRMLPPPYEPYILMLTSSADVATVKEAMQAGANGYVVKLPPREEFVKRIYGILTARPRATA